MTLLRAAWLVVSMLLVTGAVSAAPPPEPRVDYSADSTMETEEGVTIKSRVYHTRNKERMEMGGADGTVTIIRKDKNVMWQLMGNMYMEMPLDQSDSSDLSDMDVEQTVVGEETINGIKTTKSKVIATKKDGSKFGGFFWTTKDGITVKMDLLSKEGNNKIRITNELTNLKVGKLDPALFEIPEGYTKNDMGAMMGKGGMPDIGKMMREAEQDEEKEKKPTAGRDKSPREEGHEGVDVNKMLKGLFGR